VHGFSSSEKENQWSEKDERAEKKEQVGGRKRRKKRGKDSG
jgi:hypothetical protein